MFDCGDVQETPAAPAMGVLRRGSIHACETLAFMLLELADMLTPSGRPACLRVMDKKKAMKPPEPEPEPRPHRHSLSVREGEYCERCRSIAPYPAYDWIRHGGSLLCPNCRPSKGGRS